MVVSWKVVLTGGQSATHESCILHRALDYFQAARRAGQLEQLYLDHEMDE